MGRYEAHVRFTSTGVVGSNAEKMGLSQREKNLTPKGKEQADVQNPQGFLREALKWSEL